MPRSAIPIVSVLLASLACAGCGSGGARKTITTVVAGPSTASTTTTTSPATNSQSSTAVQAPASSTQAPQPVAVEKRSKGEAPKPEEHVGRTAFLGATGRGFGAFHAYISKPLRRAQLKSKSSLVMAANAALYASHEVRRAARAAAAEPGVASLRSPLEGLAANLTAIGKSFEGGSIDEAAILRARSELDSISISALNLGQPIQEVTPAIH